MYQAIENKFTSVSVYITHSRVSKYIKERPRNFEALKELYSGNILTEKHPGLPQKIKFRVNGVIKIKTSPVGCNLIPSNENDLRSAIRWLFIFIICLTLVFLYNMYSFDSEPFFKGLGGYIVQAFRTTTLHGET